MRLTALASALGILLIGGCAAARPPSRALPAADASPETVVKAYVEALNAGDVTALGSLTSAQFAKNHEPLWRRHHYSITELTFTGPAERPPQAPRDAMVLSMPVTFTQTLDPPDETMPNGRHRWSYHVCRGQDTERWAVCNEGLG